MTIDTAVTPSQPTAPFGSVFGPTMSASSFDGAVWTVPEVVALDTFELHPGTHALHYGSSCFEGLKAHRFPDGRVVPFRLDRHAVRLAGSAARLHLPQPSAELTTQLVEQAVAANADLAPDPPGSLYLRPTLLGTDVTIGAATAPSRTAVLYVLACPVGEYLPPHPLTVAVETELPRTTPQFGVVKTGANYAMALGPTMVARDAVGADQLLFAPGGVLQETGASNVLLLDGERILTPALTDGYLHGVTRDSLLRLAHHLGWSVDEREVSVDDLVEWIASPTAELALCGTAAIVGTVATLVVDGQSHKVGTPGSTPAATELRAALVAIQTGRTSFDWR